MTALYVDQDSFQPKQWTGFDSDAITRRQEWPRLMRHTCCYQCLDGSDFSFVDSSRAIVESNNLDNTWRLQYGKPVLRIEAAEQIPREERRVDFLDSIGPALSHLIQGQKPFVTLSVEMLGDAGFLPGAHLQCKPRKNVAALALEVAG